MDKVIIDGIDISECSNFKFGTCSERLCKLNVNENCYYKQLKRAEIEIEKLKGVDGSVHPDSAYYKIARLEQENEQLKADIESRTMCITCERELQNCNLQAENERLKARLRPLEDSYFKGLSSIEIAELAKKSIRITAENRKLEYALQEIRDELKEDTTCESRECGCDDYGECLNCLKETILTKINEVIGEKNE